MHRLPAIHRRERAARAQLRVCALALIGGLFAGGAGAGQIDAATFFLLRPGMAESEVLIRAGAPDLITSPGGERLEFISGGRLAVKSERGGFNVFRRVEEIAVTRWHYIPDRAEHDPYLTIVTMKRGHVFNLERKKVFSRHALPEPPAAAPSRVPSDSEIVRRRLERTMSAAERYARTRARLKREDIELRRAAAQLPETSVLDVKTKVYRSTDAEGRVYYGDRPPAESANVIEY